MLQCVGRECPLGTSIADNGIYRLRTRLPRACNSPTVVASKSGYVQSSAQLLEDTITLPLKTLRPVTINVVKHPYDLEAKTYGDALPLSTVENVSIRITLPNSTLDQFILYPGNDTAQLVDGPEVYDVSLLLSQFGSLSGGYIQDGMTIDSSSGMITFHVIEARPVGFNDEYRASLATTLYGTEYQSRLAPESGP